MIFGSKHYKTRLQASGISKNFPGVVIPDPRQSEGNEGGVGMGNTERKEQKRKGMGHG
jgi:hypothetical protein